MRTELYADSRDEHKWSVAIQQAQNTQTVFWVVMLRPNIGKHGNTRHFVPNALPVVTQFFAQERRRHALGHPKNLSRISSLCSQANIGLSSEMAPYPSAMSARSRYIDRVVSVVKNRKDGAAYLVLLDPDNGIGKTQDTGEQVHESHVQEIWQNLRVGDTLAIVQFQQPYQGLGRSIAD